MSECEGSMRALCACVREVACTSLVSLQLFHQAAADFKQKLSKSNEKQKAMYKAMFSPDKPKPEKKRSSGVSQVCVQCG